MNEERIELLLDFLDTLYDTCGKYGLCKRAIKKLKDEVEYVILEYGRVKQYNVILEDENRKLRRKLMNDSC